MDVNEAISILETDDVLSFLPRSQEAWQTLKSAVLAQRSDNSAMDAIVLIKEVAERMNQSTNDGCSITLCRCHGLGARIIELAQQHQ